MRRFPPVGEATPFRLKLLKVFTLIDSRGNFVQQSLNTSTRRLQPPEQPRQLGAELVDLSLRTVFDMYITARNSETRALATLNPLQSVTPDRNEEHMTDVVGPGAIDVITHDRSAM